MVCRWPALLVKLRLLQLTVTRYGLSVRTMLGGILGLVFVDNNFSPPGRTAASFGAVCRCRHRKSNAF